MLSMPVTCADSLILTYTEVLRPNLLNELRFGCPRRRVNRCSDALIGDNTELFRAASN